MFHAGAARAIITPPVGLELSGWAFGPSVGVLDDLEAQALVVESDGGQAVIVTADLIGFSPELVAAVRARVEGSLGIPGRRVLMSASHTHSGPATVFLRHWGEMDEGYLRTLEAQLVGLVGVAQRNVKSARLGSGLGRADNVVENRRVRGSTVDPSVPVLRLDDADGRTLAVLYNFGCHPICVHSYRNLISPDYPGYARAVVRSVLGQDVVVMFTLGGAGDTHPPHWRMRGTPADAHQIGSILGCEVAKVALDPEVRAESTVRTEQTVIDLPVEPLPEPAELRQMIEQGDAEARQLRAEGRPRPQVAIPEIRRDWAAEALRARESGELKTSRVCEVQGIRLGDVAIVALPLEVFAETALAIKAESPAKLTLVVSNSNGELGYMPTKHAFEVSGDYTNGQGNAPKVYDLYAFSPGAEPLVRETAVQVLRSLYSD